MIDASERAAVAFTVSGLDADAIAVVTVSDGTASVSGSLSADGTLLLDLSGLSDGPLTSSVTATDTGGATATVAGPGLSLSTVPSPPLSFAGETRALSIDLGAESYAYAARVLPIGDSHDLRLSRGHRSGDARQREEQEGYRGDLFEGLVGAGAFIDYVGRYESGPDGSSTKIIRARPAWSCVRSSTTGPAGRPERLQPDIVLLMAGTNDVNASGSGSSTSCSRG